MIKCVIFDMDGVVVNSEPVSYAANQEMYKSLDIVVPDDVYATFTGNSDKNIAQKLIDLYKLEISLDELLQKKFDHLMLMFDKIELMPGVTNLIADLHDNGIKLILASSSSKRKIEKIFTHFNLHKYFDAIISGEDFEFSKPDPAIFLEAVSKSGFAKNECIIIEDSTNGIKAAKAAGVYCIAYQSEHALLQDTSLADKIITNFKELTADNIKTISQ